VRCCAVVAAIAASPAWAALTVTNGLQLWFEAGAQNYQTIPNNPGTVDMTTVVGPVSNVGDRVGTTLNLADNPTLVAGGLWSPPAQQTVISPTDRRPTLQDVGGKKVLRFDGAVAQTLVSIHSAASWGSITQLNTNTQSWFLVYRPGTAAQTSTMLFTTTGNNTTSGIIRMRLNAGTLEVAADPSATSNFATSTLTAPASLSAFSIVSLILNGTTMEAFQDGVSLGTISGLSGTPGFQRARIGGATGTSDPFTGDITAALGYNVALNSTDRLAVEDYLRTNLVPPTSLAGDFNGNGIVDGADYVVWRKNMSNDSSKYTEWRSHFGNSGSGSGLNLAAAVPEPASVFLAIAVGFAVLSQRAAAGRRRPS